MFSRRSAVFALAALTGSPAPATAAQSVPPLSIRDVSVVEGDGGAADTIFRATLSAAAG